MIDIPMEVKELFGKDSIHKNLRISFPNGEHSDLTNEDIVLGSFSFTESLCSRQEFKFGLCEASILEFQAHGVGNISGCTINAEIEIDCSSLGDEWCSQNAIRKADVDYPYYPVSYGNFQVHSCTKAGKRLWKIEAYSSVNNSFGVTDFETQKQLTSSSHPYNRTTVYSFDVAKFLISNGYLSISDYKIEELTTDDTSAGFGSYNYGPGYWLNVIVYYTRYKMDTLDKTKALLWYKDCYSETVPAFEEELIKFIERQTRSGIEICYNEDREYFLKQVRDISFPKLNTPGRIMTVKGTNGIVYPFINYDSFSGEVEFKVPYSVTVYMNYTNENHVTTHIDSMGFQLNNDWDIYEINPYQERSVTLDFKDYKEINVRTILESYCELGGAFGTFKRDGSFSRLWFNKDGWYPRDTLFPGSYQTLRTNSLAVKKSMYQTCEYDDEPTRPYAYVSAKYTNAEGEADQYIRSWIVDEQTYYENMDKYQGYFLDDNFIISHNKWAEDDIRDIVDRIAGKIRYIQYTPFMMKMKALPYIEAGDFIDVHVDDKPFSSYVLRRVISGINTMTDEIEAK